MSAVLRLPQIVTACLFDLDGVLTKTATVHAAAWKQMFDGYLRERADADGTTFVPFDARDDYIRFVDGRTRADGVRTFLAARRVVLPEGEVDDPPGVDTVHGLAHRKNELVLEALRRDGVEAYEGSVRFVHAAREAGLRCAVVSSSANCLAVLAAAGIADLFDAGVDAGYAARHRLAGKPAPDTYLAAARQLRTLPPAAAVFEDALAGVEAAHAGGFGLVVGVDRSGQAAALRAHGADLVVRDLGDLLAPPAARLLSDPRRYGRGAGKRREGVPPPLPGAQCVQGASTGVASGSPPPARPARMPACRGRSRW